MKWVNSRNGFDYDDSTINVVDVLLLLKFVADRACNSGDTLADRQTGRQANTQTHGQTRSSQVLGSRSGVRVKTVMLQKNGALIRQF